MFRDDLCIEICNLVSSPILIASEGEVFLLLILIAQYFIIFTLLLHGSWSLLCHQKETQLYVCSSVIDLLRCDSRLISHY